MHFNKNIGNIDKIQYDLLPIIKEPRDSSRSELSKYLSAFETKIDGKLKTEQFSRLVKLGNVQDALEDSNRVAKLNDVILRGIPLQVSKNLTYLFSLIGKTIGYTYTASSSVDNIYRMSSPQNSNDAPILIQFSSIMLKREFMSCYRKKGQLKLFDIGVKSDSPIYAGDNLTKLNYSIYLKAHILLRAKKLTKLQIRQGIVYVTFLSTPTEWIKILHPDELIDL